MFKTKKTLRALAAATVALSATVGFAAQDSATLNVTASVAAVCKLTLSGDLAFGAMDPTVNAPATASATATYQCTKGTPITSFTVGTESDGSYSNTMAGLTGGNTDTIGYTITWDNTTVAFTGGGMGAAGTSKTVTLNGTVPYANFSTKTPDSYKGTVAIAVNY